MKPIRRKFYKSFCAALAACIFFSAFPALAQPLTPEQKAAIEKAVKDSLKDADSAQFKWLDYIGEDIGGIYCGMVNAKNGFGGYAGYSPYVGYLVKTESGYKASIIHIGADDPNDGKTAAIINSCAKEGYHFTD
ncbi:MAG: hypothetical protein HYS17_03285 [Micavibrio aeruginosavorus]|uniref:Uncharacterized protein n=1 Tax=Micavibrio aeruginosavorus TaxID=349221 RepID=A0A7T5R3H5_9BACT|nr:MAG: hypothetical protein HYS17_03285 [Micavibrio aeruginosavorus]